MTTPKMKTASPLTHHHCACYYKIRTIVRTTVGISVLLGALWVGGWVDSIDLPPATQTHNQPTQGKVTKQ